MNCSDDASAQNQPVTPYAAGSLKAALGEIVETFEQQHGRHSDVRVGTSTPVADPSGDYPWALFARADKLVPGVRRKLEAKALRLAMTIQSIEGQKILDHHGFDAVGLAEHR